MSRRIAARRTGPALQVSDARPVKVEEPARTVRVATVAPETASQGDAVMDRPAADGAGPDAGAAAIRAYEDANDKASTPAQRQLLTTIASQFDVAARDNGTTGWAWVTAAIYEAVESGSAYVAPRRIRQILVRWQREGRPAGDDPDGGGRPGGRPAGPVSARRNDTATRTGRMQIAATPASRAVAAPVTRPATAVTGSAAAVAASPRTGPRRVGRKAEPITVPAAAEPVVPAVSAVPRTGAPLPVSFHVAECGLSSGQVWAAMLTELALSGEVPRADLDSAIRSAELVGRGDGEGLVIGASSAMTQRRASRYLPALRRAAEAIVGVPVPVEVAIRGPWLAQHPDRGLEAHHAQGEASQGG